MLPVTLALKVMNLRKTLMTISKTIQTLEVMCLSTASYKSMTTNMIKGETNKQPPVICSILDYEVHQEIKKKLKKNRMIDNMVDHVLTKNITVYKAALERNTIVDLKHMRNIRRHKLPKHFDKEITVGRFTKVEDSIILENLKELINDSNLIEEDAKAELFEKTSDDDDIGIKQNIVGYYLAQGLGKVRLASNVFHRARLLLCLKTGQLSRAEDVLILQSALQGKKEWSKLGREMRRTPEMLINRFELLSSPDNIKHGAYTMEEDQKILVEVFRIKENVLDGDNLSKHDWEEIANKLQRYHFYLYNHWIGVLEPMLKRYHAGTLHVDVREVLINHMVEQGMDHVQDVDWNKLVKLDKFAGTTANFLQRKYNDLKKNTTKKYPGLSPKKIASTDIRRYLDNSQRNGTQKRRERGQQLINFYEKNILNKKIS